MNYGYICDGWTKSQKSVLAWELRKLLEAIGYLGWEKEGVLLPYIEIDQLYKGVRIRRMTNLSDEAHGKLIKDADEVYEKIVRELVHKNAYAGDRDKVKEHEVPAKVHPDTNKELNERS